MHAHYQRACRDLDIHVDVTAQKIILEKFGQFEDGLPIFPLNTGTRMWSGWLLLCG